MLVALCSIDNVCAVYQSTNKMGYCNREIYLLQHALRRGEAGRRRGRITITALVKLVAVFQLRNPHCYRAPDSQPSSGPTVIIML